MLLARETAMVSSRSAASIYPSLVQHLRKKARYALRLVRSETQPSAAGGAAMQEVSFGLSLVRETAELCMRYLDPSERSLYAQADDLVLRLTDTCGRAQIYGACSAENGCEAFFAEADEAVCAYRRLLAELDRRCKEGRLLAVLPPTYLVWADEICALVHHSLKQLARGRQIPDIADGLEESEGEAVRAEKSCDAVGSLPEPLAEQVQQAQAEPIIILADSAEDETAVRKGSAIESITEKAVEEEPIESEQGAGIERICAKASDYKNIVAKTVEKQREHCITKPRPLGRRA